MKTPFLLLASLGLCVVARAESPDSIPDPRQSDRSSIYDGARVLNDGEKRRINDAINGLENRTKAQMMVVTIQSLDGESIEDWSNTLFRRIGIGRKGQDDGVLFVFAMKDRKSRIEVGFGLEDRLTDARCGEILREQITPAFRRSAYGEGILDGVQVAANYIEGGTRPAPKSGYDVPASSSSGSSGSGFSSSPSNSGGSGAPIAILLLVGTVIGGAVGTAVHMAKRPRRCPQCKAGMNITDAPDSDLTNAERVERSMGSRSFQRCTCPKCGYSDIDKKDLSVAGVVRCTRCGNRTARQQKRTITAATYSSSGKEEVTTTCEYPPCGHIDKRKHTIPRLQRSTSSSSSGGYYSSSSSSSGSSYDGGSSSSYGGGDSGGGGGSSSW